ncbi:MAG: ZIP family metal transporter [Thermoplasmatota archaeon]
MITANVLLLGLLAGATIFLGLPAARLPFGARWKGFLNALAIGILLFLFAEVLLAGWKPVEQAFQAGAPTYGWGLGALFAGGVAFGLLSLVWFENRHLHRAGPATHEPSPERLAFMVAIGIGLHNFSEGLAIGAKAASGALGFAVILAVGFALHNATEGFGIAAPLGGRKPSWGFLAVAGAVAGGPTFFGAVLGSLLESPTLNVLFLSLAAGSLLYVVKELLYHGRRRSVPADSFLSMGGVVVGLLLGLATDLVVTLAGI